MADPVETPAEETRSSPALTIVVQSWATPIAALVMLLVGLLAGYFVRPLIDKPPAQPTAIAAAPTSSAGATQAPSPAQDGSPQEAASRQELQAAVVAATKHFTGNPDAPVTMIEFSDFQCPYCGVFASKAGSQLFEEYIKTGKVRFGYMHFTFLGDESGYAAEASECAGEQNAFWEYHDYLFEQLASEDQQDFTKDNLKRFAADMELDAKAFDACLDSGKYAQEVSQQTSFAQSLGVRSTPSFVINGQAVVGAQSFETFQQVIESELSR